MAILLFRLNNVPEDEAEEIRELLHEHDIPFNETQAGRFRIGLAAIWLLDASYLEQAQALISDYQTNRFENAQDEKRLLKQMGLIMSFILRFQENPLQFTLTIVALLLVLGASILPFLYF